MARRTIRISAEAYSILKQMKSKDESFSGVILRLTATKSRTKPSQKAKLVAPYSKKKVTDLEVHGVDVEAQARAGSKNVGKDPLFNLKPIKFRKKIRNSIIDKTIYSAGSLSRIADAREVLDEHLRDRRKSFR